jgi:hypothetical protein
MYPAMFRINYYHLLHLLYLCLSMSWEIVGKLTYTDLVAGFCQRSMGSCLDF